MNNLVFYRKYRPQKFEDVVGQRNIIEILKNAVLQNKIAHAYLFSGPRGTGKTTTARILAKSADSSPEDTIEIDAASQRGIDDARALREGVWMLPFNSSRKTYIIDEVHMLTREAFNALLKIIEEPPEHAIFILCTTELSKVPDTIVSRTQHFEFGKIPISEISSELKKISKKEKLQIEDSAIKLVSFFAEGSLRDAANILFQLSGFSKNGVILESDARLLLGAPSGELVNKIVFSIFEKNLKNMLGFFDEAIKSGVEPHLLGKLILRNLRASYFFALDSSAHILKNEFGEEEIKFFGECVQKISDHKFFDFAIREILNALSAKADDFTSHIPMELALIKIASI